MHAMMCMGYRLSRKDEDNTNDKKVLNAAMIEIRKCKRRYEQKLVCNIKNDRKSFMHKSGVNKMYETRLEN